jgi:hypothetical protein
MFFGFLFLFKTENKRDLYFLNKVVEVVRLTSALPLPSECQIAITTPSKSAADFGLGIGFGVDGLSPPI